MTYRHYISGDFVELYAIEEICFQPPFRFARWYMRRLLESPGTIAWVAEENAQLVGFAIADCEWETGGVAAYIQTIEVLPAMRRCGVGAELLRRIEDSARERGTHAIWLHVDSENAGAIRLYESHGFACEGRKEGYYPQGRSALIYRKQLPSHDTPRATALPS